MPSNADIAAVFEQMAALLEMKGEVVFKIRAYQRAARTIEHLPFSIEERVASGQPLKGIPGIGEAIEKKTIEFIRTGAVRALEELRGELPDGVLTLMNVPGIGPKTAMRVARELGVTTIEGLEKAILEGRMAALPRMGEKTAENILRHIRALSLRTKDKRTPIGVALPVAEEVIAALRERCPGLHKLTPAGSLRRWRETVGDIDLMGAAAEPQQAIDVFVKLPQVQEVIGHGPKKASAVVVPGIQVDLRIVEDESYGALIQYFTGSQQHNIRLRDRANRMGLSLNEYGITDIATGRVERFADEEAFYARLGLQLMPPEVREGVWELDLAERCALPRLVELGDIRGDLHVHSDWSDGREPLETMVAAAAARGYQYVAITDHSAGRGIANGLSEERLRQQIDVLRDLSARHSIAVLTGSEVDIRADGSLDYSDEMLAALDVVVASVHSAMGQERERMTQRIIQAMRHPSVTVIGHLTCRLLGERDPIEVDVEAIFQAALETGAILEINASPERLDLRDVHVQRARELGVPLVISTDAHHSDQLAHMRFGVAVVRRGWCEARHILNTLPRERFLALIKAPKPERARLIKQGVV
ncbi:MAG: DNA polymerase/3'-5' exonuclease PolX [Chloroflexota bacterium]|nr:DNA polymerase/3'-5' exonuclease PolX [Chloroflexota bacterium]